jgi:hypothetical protein
VPTNTAERDTRIEFEERVWTLRQKGYTHRRIAAELAVNHGTVGRAIRRVAVRALARLDSIVAAQMLATIERLDFIVEEALLAWERSKKPKKRSSKRTAEGKGKAGEKAEASQTTHEAQERDGDPAFLAVAMEAMDRMRRLLDMDRKPAADTGPTGSDLRSALAEAEASDAHYSPDEPAAAVQETPPDAPTA